MCVRDPSLGSHTCTVSTLQIGPFLQFQILFSNEVTFLDSRDCDLISWGPPLSFTKADSSIFALSGFLEKPFKTTAACPQLSVSEQVEPQAMAVDAEQQSLSLRKDEWQLPSPSWDDLPEW